VAHAVGIRKQRYGIVSCVMNALGRCFAEDVGGSFCILRACPLSSGSKLGRLPSLVRYAIEDCVKCQLSTAVDWERETIVRVPSSRAPESPGSSLNNRIESVDRKRL
jgi:hypothetical protein